MLAATGLLDGRPATSHWIRLPGLREGFPKVDWVSGVQYVDDGNVITTAGVLSGIDGALRIIERLIDVNTAREAAREAGWRHYSPGAPARIPESGWEPQDVVVALNASYNPGPSTIGVRLVDGAGELELASAFISYTEQAMVGRTIAGTYDVQTARWTAKSLEYPVSGVELTGRSWPWPATIIPVLLALLGAAVAIATVTVFRRIRARSTDRPDLVRGATDDSRGLADPATV